MPRDWDRPPPRAYRARPGAGPSGTPPGMRSRERSRSDGTDWDQRTPRHRRNSNGNGSGDGSGTAVWAERTRRASVREGSVGGPGRGGRDARAGSDGRAGQTGPGRGGPRRPDGSPRHGMAPAGRKRQRSWAQRLVLVTGVLVVMACLSAAGGAMWVMRKISSIDQIDVDVDHSEAGEPTNYLVVGSDTRATSDGEFGDVGGQRSDTIMVVRLDPQTDKAYVLSLPRDLMVPIAGHDSSELEKLNSAYSESNQALIDTIRLNFGIEINHYLVVDFVGFQRLVDAVGGVSIHFDTAVKDDNSGLFVEELGCVTLTGEQALAYARSRHLQYMTDDGWSREDPMADLGRIQRQQIFIRAALDRTLEQVRHLNPAQLADLVDIGTDSVSLDDQTDPFELYDQFSGFDLNNLTTYSLPVIDLVPEVSVQMDPVNAPSVLAVFRGEDPNDVPAGTITVDVLNGTGVDNQANDVAAALQAVGFRLGERSDYDQQPVEHTMVLHRPGEEIIGLRVARHITGGAQLQEQAEIPSGHVTVVTGQDLTTIHMQPTPVDQMPSSTGGAGAGGSSSTTGQTTETTAPPQTTTTTTTPPSQYTIGEPC